MIVSGTSYLRRSSGHWDFSIATAEYNHDNTGENLQFVSANKAWKNETVFPFLVILTILG